MSARVCARQQLLLAPLERAEARHQPRLGRESGEQALREGVDGLDAKAAAGGVEHLGEQGAARSAQASGPMVLAERHQLLRQARRPSAAPSARAARWIRPAISAAPALVKVRQRIEAGSTPASSSRSTRAVSTWVLPVPAEADSAAWSRGRGGAELVAFEQRQRAEAVGHGGRQASARAPSVTLAGIRRSRHPR